MYFNNLIELLKKNNTTEERLKNIINPFSLYYLCNHYYGNEIKTYNISIPLNKNNLLVNNNISLIKDFDIIHVQVDLFSNFCNNVLTKINKKIILTTGQWQLPQIKKNDLTEKVLNNENVLLWISQNPIYDNNYNSKYIAFPYGIAHYNLEDYSKILLTDNNTKTIDIINLPINNKTNICREKLPKLKNISPENFYLEMMKSKFIISPIGDRDDCYRHYEAIGLGTIPISNVNPLYKNIFGSNMYYCDIDEMLKILSQNKVNHTYTEPNKDLICFEYYKNNIMNMIKLLEK